MNIIEEFIDRKLRRLAWLSGYKKESNEEQRITYEQYVGKIGNIQSEELNLEKYKTIYRNLCDNYWNRDNRELEDKLFSIINKLKTTEFLTENDYNIEIEKMNIYYELKEFITSLTNDDKESNIFLRYASIYEELSEVDCTKILDILNITTNNSLISDTIESTILPNVNIPKNPVLTGMIELPISHGLEENIPDYVATQVSIPYYKPEVYKKDYIDVLDEEHKYVYDEYNDVVRKLTDLAENIYLLKFFYKLKDTTLIPGFVHIYHPGFENRIICKFYSVYKERQNINIAKKEEQGPVKKLTRDKI